MRQRDGRLKLIQADFHDTLIVGICIGRKCAIVPLNMILQIGFRGIIHGEDTILSASFDRHIADGKAVIHRERGDTFSTELNGAVQRTVYTDLPDQVQHNVFSRNKRLQLALQDDKNRRGDFEPSASGCHCTGEVCGSDACTESSERAIGAGMRITADDDFSGSDKSLLGKKRMFDAHASGVIKISDIMLHGKTTKLCAEFGGLDILARNRMVQHKDDFIRVKNVCQTGFFKFSDCDRGGNIVSQYQI